VTRRHGDAVLTHVTGTTNAERVRFEHTMVVWPPADDGKGTQQLLNELGADWWEAVGLAPRAAPSPVPGMGAAVVPEIVVLLKRRLAD
jgi:hypothetical protein